MNKQSLAALALGMAMFAAGAMAETTFTPGTYTGEATGMGHMQVEVTLSESGIESVKVTEDNETPAIGGEVLKTLPDTIVAKQSTQLDTRNCAVQVVSLTSR